MKILLILLAACIVWRLLTGRWPWQPRRSRQGGIEETKARTLLGVSRDAGRDEIIDAHRALIARVHPDRGGTSGLVHEANAARDLLLGRLPSPDKDPS